MEHSQLDSEIAKLERRIIVRDTENPNGAAFHTPIAGCITRRGLRECDRELPRCRCSMPITRGQKRVPVLSFSWVS